jgi:formylmethanofuran dehydrogenase subunit E
MEDLRGLVCEECGCTFFDEDHLEWIDRCLCPSCYDKYIADNMIIDDYDNER